MLVQQISEVEEWDAILLQELSFNDEFLSLEDLEASLGGHKLVTNVECPWDTAIVIVGGWVSFAGLPRHRMLCGLVFVRRKSSPSALRTCQVW